MHLNIKFQMSRNNVNLSEKICLSVKIRIIYFDKIFHNKSLNVIEYNNFKFLNNY